MEAGRNFRTDLLSFVGLAMIILAHVGTTGLVFQLRNFDVALLILSYGLVFGSAYILAKSYAQYLWQVTKSLIFPVWIFLSVFFLALYIINPESYDLDPKIIVSSYLFAGGIGYVWLIKILFLVSVIAPFIYSFHHKTRSNKYYFIVLATVFCVYELIRYLSLPYIRSGTGYYFSLIFYYLIPFGVIFAVGLRMSLFNRKQTLRLIAFSISCFIVLALVLFLYDGAYVSTQAYKNPPSFYYFSYAMSISCLIWYTSEFLEEICKKLKIDRLMSFVAKHLIWVYLWHIPFVKYIQIHFFAKYLIVMSLALGLVYIQVFIVKKIVNTLSSTDYKKNLLILFTG